MRRAIKKDRLALAMTLYKKPYYLLFFRREKAIHSPEYAKDDRCEHYDDKKVRAFWVIDKKEHPSRDHERCYSQNKL